MKPLIHGVHANHSELTDAPVLFINFGQATWRDALETCKRGGFRVAMATMFQNGDWQTPRYFESFEGLDQACQAFRDAGIELMLHGFWNVLHQHGAQGLGVDFADPGFNWRDELFTISVGNVAEPVGTADETIAGNRIIKSDIWSNYAERFAYTPNWGNLAYDLYAIESELVRCANENIVVDDMIDVVRGVEKTTRKKHAVGAAIEYVPYRSGFFMRHGSALQAASIRNFAQTVATLGISGFYCDGWSYPPFVDEDYARATEGMFHRGIEPYLAHVDGLVMFGGQVPVAAEPCVYHQAIGDALWVFDQGRFDFDRWIGKFKDIASREDRSMPFRKCAGWLPLCGELTAEHVERIYRELPFRKRIWQHIPSQAWNIGGRMVPIAGWESKPKSERDALLALIRSFDGSST